LISKEPAFEGIYEEEFSIELERADISDLADIL
jgi:hypothetical protein